MTSFLRFEKRILLVQCYALKASYCVTDSLRVIRSASCKARLSKDPGSLPSPLKVRLLHVVEERCRSTTYRALSRFLKSNLFALRYGGRPLDAAFNILGYNGLRIANWLLLLDFSFSVVKWILCVYVVKIFFSSSLVLFYQNYWVFLYSGNYFQLSENVFESEIRKFTM